MDVREYLVKAQEADAIANSAQSYRECRRWEAIAKEYRRLAHAIVAMERDKVPSDPSMN